MGYGTSKERLIEALNLIKADTDAYNNYTNDIIEGLRFAIDNFDSQDLSPRKEAYIATLEAKVYTYEMIIAKSNFRSMLDTTHNDKPSNRQNDRQPNNQRNNQRGNNRSALGQRSQKRSQYRNQDGSYRPVNPKNHYDNAEEETE